MGLTNRRGKEHADGHGGKAIVPKWLASSHQICCWRRVAPGPGSARRCWMKVRLYREGRIVGRKEFLILLGTYSFAEEVADLISDCEECQLMAFAENWDRERCAGQLLDRPILWVEDLPPLAATHRAVCALGTTQRRGFIEQVE